MPLLRKPIIIHSPMRPRYHPQGQGRPNSRITKVLLGLLLILIAFLLIFLPARDFLNEVAGSMAISDAKDLVTSTVNETVLEILGSGDYDYNYFVTMQKDSEGAVTSLSANMPRINAFSAKILKQVINATATAPLSEGIPLGTLIGSPLTLGRGPKIPVKVVVLTSSYSDFKNELTSVGINQSKHQIILQLRVEIDILLPWKVQSDEVDCEVLIAETIIVGRVPETYLTAGI
ncbi:MAG: sporulation protein YunB [Oscillospiraceae bacterium]|nr:sporulation protein YunB [Oscillospiraceae bacterium]